MRSCERMMTATAADVAWQACCLFPHATLLESQHCQLLALWVRSDAWGGLDHQEVDSNGCFVSLNVTIIFVFCFSRFTSSKCPGAMAVQKAFTDATASSSTFRWVSVQVWARVTVSKGPNALKPKLMLLGNTVGIRFKVLEKLHIWLPKLKRGQSRGVKAVWCAS